MCILGGTKKTLGPCLNSFLGNGLFAFSTGFHGFWHSRKTKRKRLGSFLVPLSTYTMIY